MHRSRVVVIAALALAFTGPASAALDALAGLPGGSYVTDDGRVAVPLAAPAPAWYTQETHDRVLAASAKGLAFDVDRGVDVPLASQFLFIRPGAMMLFPAACTMNFIYGSPGAYQIGSAGHCAERGDDVVIAAAPSLLVAIGKVKTSHDNGIGDDWLVAPISAQFQQFVDPNVAVIGGPQGGAYTGGAHTLTPVPVKHFGHGLVVGTGGTPRAGVSLAADNRAYYMDSVAAPGDSGSPVLVAGSAQFPLGQAYGVLTHLIVDYRKLPAVVAGTRVTQVNADVVDGDVNPVP